MRLKKWRQNYEAWVNGLVGSWMIGASHPAPIQQSSYQPSIDQFLLCPTSTRHERVRELLKRAIGEAVPPRIQRG